MIDIREAFLHKKVKLDGKKVVITGASSGIGKSIAIDLARLGCSVCIFDIDEKNGLDTLSVLKDACKKSFFVRCDITDVESVRQSFKKANSLMGGIDILINNAGISSKKTALEEISEDFWKKVMEVNLTGSYICSREVLGYFKKNPGGNIVMISSGSALTGSGGSIAYAASKGGLNSLIRGLSRELAPRNIRVNGVAPRYIDSELLKRIYKGKDIKRLTEKIPLKRLGTLEDISNAVIFLASELSSFITGETILLDGGSTFGK